MESFHGKSFLFSGSVLCLKSKIRLYSIVEVKYVIHICQYHEDILNISSWAWLPVCVLDAICRDLQGFGLARAAKELHSLKEGEGNQSSEASTAPVLCHWAGAASQKWESDLYALLLLSDDTVGHQQAVS